MKLEFDIKTLRSKWEYHYKNSIEQRVDANKQIAQSSSLTIKYFAKLNFYKTLLDRTNDSTTRDELTDILNNLFEYPVIPEMISDKDFYREQWNNFIKLFRY